MQTRRTHPFHFKKGSCHCHLDLILIVNGNIKGLVSHLHPVMPPYVGVAFIAGQGHGFHVCAEKRIAQCYHHTETGLG